MRNYRAKYEVNIRLVYIDRYGNKLSVHDDTFPFLRQKDQWKINACVGCNFGNHTLTQPKQLQSTIVINELFKDYDNDFHIVASYESHDTEPSSYLIDLIPHKGYIICLNKSHKYQIALKLKSAVTQQKIRNSLTLAQQIYDEDDVIYSDFKCLLSSMIQDNTKCNDSKSIVFNMIDFDNVNQSLLYPNLSKSESNVIFRHRGEKCESAKINVPAKANPSTNVPTDSSKQLIMLAHIIDYNDTELKKHLAPQIGRLAIKSTTEHDVRVTLLGISHGKSIETFEKILSINLANKYEIVNNLFANVHSTNNVLDILMKYSSQ